MSGFKCRVFSGASFTVIPIANYNPLKASFFVITCSGWNGVPLSSHCVLDLVGFSICRINGTDEHIVRDVIEMAAIFEPRASHYEFISCGSFEQENYVALLEMWSVVVFPLALIKTERSVASLPFQA